MFIILLNMVYILLFKCSNCHVGNPNNISTQGTIYKNSNNIKTNHQLMQDFNYNNIKTSDLSKRKMTYINCNRRLFINLDKDLIDVLLLDRNIRIVFLTGSDILKSRIEIIKYSIANIFNIEKEHGIEISDKKNYTTKNLLGVEINSAIRKRLNDELIKINTSLKHENTLSINRRSILILLGFIDS